MVLGSACPLLHALQHATSEMQRWLAAELCYGFTERSAQTFMGLVTEYDITNVGDPSFTVAVKIRKPLLVSGVES